MRPDRRALEPGLRFSHPSASPRLKESERETTHINMWSPVHTWGRSATEGPRATFLKCVHVSGIYSRKQ